MSRTQERTKVPHAQVGSLIQSRITELENTVTRDVAAEREIAERVRAEQKRMAALLETTDDELDKVSLLQRKYTQLYQEMQRLEQDYAQARSSEASLRKERDAKADDLQKSNLMKQKLEALCRELQRENKRVKDDSNRLAVIEQEKRIELNNKFETTIFEIKTKMDAEHNDIGRRRIADVELREKFRSFLEQYDVRETHYQDALKAKDLQLQLLELRHERQSMTTALEADRSRMLHAQISTFGETETELRSQLNIYVDKFRQVEDTLNSSNDLFLSFRSEMETMTKKTKKLERENSLIRGKCDAANLNILEMVEERQRNRREIETLQLRSTKLEGICRALQSRRLDDLGSRDDGRQRSLTDETRATWDIEISRLTDLNGNRASTVPDDTSPGGTLHTRPASSEKRLMPLEEKLKRFIRREGVEPERSRDDVGRGDAIAGGAKYARRAGPAALLPDSISDLEILERSQQVFQALRDTLKFTGETPDMTSGLRHEMEQALDMLQCDMDAETFFGALTREECDQIFGQLSSFLQMTNRARSGPALVSPRNARSG